jgi:tRNA G18 (ribose-2'-O)-methylase SpoU
MSPVERIEDLRDPRLADYQGVRDPVRLRASGAFLAEGRLVTRVLLTRSPLSVRSVLGTEATLAWFESEGLGVPGDVPFFVLDDSVAFEIDGHRFHQGCLAAGERPADRDAAALVRAEGTPDRVVVLDTVTNPDNVGAIFRTAEALGAGAVALTGRSASPLYRKAIRSSMGATLTVPYSHAGEGPETVRALRDMGYTVLAFAPDAEGASLESVVDAGLPTRLALLFGSEGHGLSSATLDAADRRVSIPIVETSDSLNVAAAAAIALYATR